jgi:hypothetical protein
VDGLQRLETTFTTENIAKDIKKTRADFYDDIDFYKVKVGEEQSKKQLKSPAVFPRTGEFIDLGRGQFIP